jgi:hypothetical protein
VSRIFPPTPRRWRPGAAIFGLGFVVGLAGDACHVASGTTRYDWSGVPVLWRSAIWFPFLVGGAVLAAAWGAERAGPAAVRVRTRGDVVLGAAVVLAHYALTAALRHRPATVSVVLTGAVAVAVLMWWEPSLRGLSTAALAAVAGPAAEIAVVGAGAAHYAHDTDGLFGVAPWLPCLYFAAGAVASTLWPALAGDPRIRPSRS